MRSVPFHRYQTRRPTANRSALFKRKRSPSSRIMHTRVDKASPGFWSDAHAWRRASRNTLQCLVGCNIGDYGMLILLNAYQPDLSFSIVMPIAMASGLATSVCFESSILRYKEHFSWRQSFKTATSMSFMSMLAMEFSENATDYFLTGGQASMYTLWFWSALAISTTAGFLTPLPYNYYKIKKHGKSCHVEPARQVSEHNHSKGFGK